MATALRLITQQLNTSTTISGDSFSVGLPVAPNSLQNY